jgi:hypothetical protein
VQEWANPAKRGPSPGATVLGCFGLIGLTLFLIQLLFFFGAHGKSVNDLGWMAGLAESAITFLVAGAVVWRRRRRARGEVTTTLETDVLVGVGLVGLTALAAGIFFGVVCAIR